MPCSGIRDISQVGPFHQTWRENGNEHVWAVQYASSTSVVYSTLIFSVLLHTGSKHIPASIHSAVITSIHSPLQKYSVRHDTVRTRMLTRISAPLCWSDMAADRGSREAETRMVFVSSAVVGIELQLPSSSITTQFLFSFTHSAQIKSNNTLCGDGVQHTNIVFFRCWLFSTSASYFLPVCVRME